MLQHFNTFHSQIFLQRAPLLRREQTSVEADSWKPPLAELEADAGRPPELHHRHEDGARPDRALGSGRPPLLRLPCSLAQTEISQPGPDCCLIFALIFQPC